MSILVKEIRPMFNGIITTKEIYTNDSSKGGLIVKQSGALKEHQTVVAIGSSVRDIKVGDIVRVNPSRFAIKKHQEGSMRDGVITDNPVIQYLFDTVVLNNVQHLMLQDRDIDYIVTSYEEIKEEESQIYIPKTTQFKA